MKKKIFLLLFAAASIYASPARAQQSAASNVNDIQKLNEETNQKWNKSLGSFQFQIINSRINPSIDISIIDEIEKNRDKTKIVYINYVENIKIMILPESTIQQPYQKLELIKYINQ
jgi:hypothetical protein